MYSSMVIAYFEETLENYSRKKTENPISDFLLSCVDALFFLVETPNGKNLKALVIKELESDYFSFSDKK